MKKIVKCLSIVLVLTMLVSPLSICSFADGGDDPLSVYKEGTGYVALGDSFARGFGASDSWASEVYTMDNTKNTKCRNVTGSYPLIVAQTMGLNTPADITDTSAQYWPIAQNALTTAFFNDLLGLEDNFCDSEFIYTNTDLISRYKTDLYYFGSPESFAVGGSGYYGKTAAVKSLRELIQDASLITVGLGQGDVIFRTQNLYVDTIDLSNTEELPDKVAIAVEELYLAFDNWKNTYRVLLDYLKEANPDATVVLIGTVNPVENIAVSDEYLVPIGAAISVLFELMNQYYRECADEYGYIFVDISNVETPTSETDLTLTEFMGMDAVTQGLATHPSQDGYGQIARMIVNALRDKAAADEAAKTTVKVDLGRVRDVSYVLLDGKKLDESSYTVKDSVISVNCGKTTAGSLTVATVGDNGKVVLSVYALSYDNGYSARRLYTSNDVLGNAVKTLTNLGNTVKSALGSLFKK